MRIAVVWELGSGWGHLSRLSPVVRGLEARGHQVTAVLRSPEQAAPLMGGASLMPLPVAELPPADPIPVAASFADILHNVGWHSEESLRKLTSAWLKRLGELSPDLLLMDFSPGALLASQALPGARVLLSTGFSSPPEVSPFPNLLPVPDAARSARSAAREIEILGRANSFLEHAGAMRLARLAQLFSRVDLNILATWPELDHYGARREASYAGVWSDASLGNRPDWPSGSGPKVFVYSKPFPGLAALFHLLSQSGLPVLAYLSGPKASAPELTRAASVRIVDTPVDLPWAARECDLAVLNAGHGASALMLMAGTPILEIPLELEQFHVARRVAQSGAGLVAHPDSPEQIAKGLQRLLMDSSFRRRAVAFRKSHQGTSQQARIELVVGKICSVLQGARP